MSPLEAYLSHRHVTDLSGTVDWLYRAFPRPLARFAERQLTPRHMRSMADRFSFHPNPGHGWTVKRGRVRIADSLPLGNLIGKITRPVTVVATGPTANDYPLAGLPDSGRLVVACNGAPTILAKAGVRPDLYVVSDSRFPKTGMAHFHCAPGVPLVTTFRGASVLATVESAELAARPFALIDRVNSWYGAKPLPHDQLELINRQSGSPFSFPAPPDLHYKVGWSSAPELGFFSAATVVFVALQVVIGLGATDIEIVGMDLSNAGRAYDEGPEKRPTSLQTQYATAILPSFQLMHRAISGRGIRIRNLSSVCPLPVELFES